MTRPKCTKAGCENLVQVKGKKSYHFKNAVSYHKYCPPCRKEIDKEVEAIIKRQSTYPAKTN